MAEFSTFLIELFREGKVVFRTGEVARDRPADVDLAILADAFATFALSVAGPPIAFDPRVAREAAELVRHASWALVDREEPPKELRRRLACPSRRRHPRNTCRRISCCAICPIS